MEYKLWVYIYKFSCASKCASFTLQRLYSVYLYCWMHFLQLDELWWDWCICLLNLLRLCGWSMGTFSNKKM